jgi:hypothetical protein
MLSDVSDWIFPSLRFASGKGCRREYRILGSSREHSPRISWTLASDSSVERGATALSFARRDALKINAKDAKIRVSGLDQKAEINPSHLHTVAAARAEQILDANAMQTRGTLASASIGRDDRGLDSPSGALPAAKRGALPIVDLWSIIPTTLARYELGAERSELLDNFNNMAKRVLHQCSPLPLPLPPPLPSPSGLRVLDRPANLSTPFLLCRPPDSSPASRRRR